MKKKIIKPFSIEAWKNGAKVETRSGRSVRILCTDLKDNYPIVAGVAQDNGTECSCIYDADGHFCTGCEDYCDLVIVEEVEESKWADDEKAYGEGWYIGAYSNILHDDFPLNDARNRNVFATEKQAKSALAMARISQLMAHDERYGGVVTDDEWSNDSIRKYVLNRGHGHIYMDVFLTNYHFLAFHTDEQADLFLSENEQLVKDYLMIEQ